ncbi:hypothetical protein M5D96_009260 [Drosophila gunungcola]|uniref:Uncharacterized protein n=1 Tax=Drosophila gunungcola TaxID=103775 RepID=A0A9Q0BN72_9MUSC|nr:hypothetical protein M5D96_009260 [Drosophila gunungcola]
MTGQFPTNRSQRAESRKARKQESEEAGSSRPHKYIKCQKSELGPQPGSEILGGRRLEDGVDEGFWGLATLNSK